MSSLLGGSKKSSSKSTQTVNVPDWALGPLQKSLSMATTAANIPYEAYTDPRIAGFTEDELNSFSGVRGLQGDWQPAYSQANDILGTVAQSGLDGFSQEYLDKYMNPYVQNVLDVQKNRAITNFDQRMNDYRSRAAQAGAFGGSRFGLGEAQMYKDFNRQLADSETLGLASAYDVAQQGAQSGMSRAGQAGLSIANLASSGQGLGYQDLTALNTQGSQQRALQQAGLDFDYQQWMEEKQYPYTQAQFLSSIASPIAGQVSGSTTNQTTKQSSGSSLLGTALGLGSMIAAPFTGGASLGLGSLGASFSSGLGALAGMAGMSTPFNTLINPALGFGSNIAWNSPRWGSYAGGVISRYANGGNVRRSRQSTSDERMKALVDSWPVQKGNELAQWALDNPLEAAGWIATAVPLTGPAARLGMTGLKGLGLVGKAATKIHPKALVGGIGAGALALDHLLKSKEEMDNYNPDNIDPKDAKDVYELQQHLLNIAGQQTGQKIGKYSQDVEDDKDARFSSLYKKYPSIDPLKKLNNTDDNSWVKQSLGLEAAANTDTTADTPTSGGTVTQQGIGTQDTTSVSGLPNIPIGDYSSKAKKYNGLFQFGVDLLRASQDNNFFSALGAAAQAGIDRDKKDESDAIAAAKQRFDNSVELYKLSQDDRKIQNNERWQQIQAAANYSPYKQQLEQLKVAQAIQKLSQDPMAKNKLDAWKAMQQNQMALETPEGKQLNAEVMKMLMSNTGDLTSDDSTLSEPTVAIPQSFFNFPQ